jgi:hypothetical protein
MSLLNSARLAGTAGRLDTFMSDLTLTQLRATVTMGFVLTQPGLRRNYDRNFAAWMPLIGLVTEEYVVRRRAGESPLEIGVDYSEVLAGLNEGARLMRPTFPRRDRLTDGDLITLRDLQPVLFG